MHSLVLNDSFAGSQPDLRAAPERQLARPAPGVAQLVAAEGPSLLRLARSLVRDAGWAEDLVQESFVRAARALAEAPLEHPGAWLRQVLTRLAADGYRRRAVREAVGGPEPERGLESVADARSADPGGALVESELQADLRAAILALPENLRASFMARVIEQRGYAEAGELLGLEPATVRTHVMRARKILAERLAGHLGVER